MMLAVATHIKRQTRLNITYMYQAPTACRLSTCMYMSVCVSRCVSVSDCAHRLIGQAGKLTRSAGTHRATNNIGFVCYDDGIKDKATYP